MNETLLREKAEKIYQYMKRGNAGLVRQTAHAVDHDPASWGMDINDWDWNAGVGLIAISDFYKKVGDPEILHFLVDWFARNRHQCAKKDHANFLAPLAIYPDMYERTKDPYYRETAVEYADWFVRNAGRSREGIFFHGASVSGEVWADTVFMALIFLTHTAKLTGNASVADLVVAQLLGHLQLLQDERTGVLFHGYHCEEKHHMSGALWTRGNSWVVIGTPMIFETIGGMVRLPEELLRRYRRLVDGILKFQGENGLWHTVMDRPDFYQETSGSAGFAGGILKAARLKLIDSGLAAQGLKAMEGVIAQVTPEGAVDGVSGGTPIMPSIDAYGQLTRYPTLYGQGLTLLLLSEALGNETSR